MQKGALNIHRIRKDFPILGRKIRDKPLVYFDNAATTQKPLSVIDAIRDYYMNYNSNIHRAVHQMEKRQRMRTKQRAKKLRDLLILVLLMR